MKFLVALENVLAGAAGLMIQRTAILAATLLTMAIVFSANSLATAAAVVTWLALFPMTVAVASLAAGMRQELRPSA
ncbi:hypothetical protein [Pseudarthrobacter sp. BIM B-2242]|uniref:hypothetical protein n=1 Tax=Pseudarthrobacter sp. BIM B-2242 TaxID=2772401 RepID=UPI00168A99FB|nr:hypothetical protein [Pseudarthrobacter sp. BIM B-2242]QOD06002.1 hypothetical protein IDT60_20775 [Pseudarthrobacter sp. BIM B-2242]